MQSDVEIVKSRIDIVDYIGNRVQLKSAGRNFKGLCPFHQEKSPSFMVNPDLQIYKCFGCGKGGDIFNFIEEYEGVDFSEALGLAAEHIGYELKGNFGGDEQSKKEKEGIIAANKLATEYWHFILLKHNAGKPGRDYMQKRGIRKEEAEKFKLGYAPKGTNLLPFLVKKGFSEANLVKWGLAVNRDGKLYDKFRDRLQLPIFNLKGQPVGFSGRILTPSDYAPKYLNSSDSPVYHKSEILMGLYQAKDATRQAKRLVLQEGNLDLLASHKVGVENIAAVGGTAITRQQMKLVKRYAETVLLCFDYDAAGQKALVSAFEIAEEVGLEHRVIRLGEYKDPDEMIQAEPQKWEKAIEKAENTLEYLFREYAKSEDLGSPDGKSHYAKKLVPILRMMKDKVQQQHFIAKLALEVGVSSDIISQQIADSSSSLLPQPSPAPKSQNIQEELPPADNPSNREQYFLALLAATDQFAAFEEDVHPDLFNNRANRTVLDVISQQKKSNQSYHKLSETLDAASNDVLQKVLTWDLENLSEEGALEDELLKVLRRLEQDYLKQQIRDLRIQLKNSPEDKHLLKNLSLLTNQLRELS